MLIWVKLLVALRWWGPTWASLVSTRFLVVQLCCKGLLRILDHHTRVKRFSNIFRTIFRSRWPLFGPPWPSPGLRFNSLDPQESGIFFANSGKSYLDFLPPQFASDGLETIIKRSASKFRFSGYQRRVKRRSWSNFMAKILVFLLVCITSLLYAKSWKVILPVLSVFFTNFVFTSYYLGFV